MAIKACLIDTNAYSAFKQGNRDAVSVIKAADFIFINTVVIGELLAGFSLGSKVEKNREELALFLKAKRVQTLNIDAKTATFYSKIYLELRQSGTPIPTNDLWIAASAKQYQLPVFTYDKHFANIKKLDIVESALDF